MTPPILLIYRAERFSPNAVERDKAVMDAVAARLRNCGAEAVDFLHEEDLESDVVGRYAGSTVIHMTRSDDALRILEEMERRGSKVVNSPKALRQCSRAKIEAVMAKLGLLTPKALIERYPELGGKGWWEKSDDTRDSSEGHVSFSPVCPPESDGKILQPHIDGRVLKFYGVRGTDFFHVREDIDEDVQCRLRKDAGSLADTLGLDIYGGDAVLTESRLLTIIDFNDFPSFSCCREQAADGIQSIINR